MIDQRAATMSDSEFAGFKQYVHSQQADIPDHTDAPATLELQDHIPLGIVDETKDSISFGMAMRFQPTGSGVLAPVWLGSINIALQFKGETLTLYAFDTLETPTETAGLKSLAARWLKCIRAGNPWNRSNQSLQPTALWRCASMLILISVLSAVAQPRFRSGG